MINYLIPAIAGAIFLILSVTFASIWVYKDAKKRGLPAGMWVLLVLLGGNLIGLMLYVLVGRKQESVTCGKCGSITIGSGNTFCSSCGEQLIAKDNRMKTNNSPLVVSIACIVMTFISLGILLFSLITANGFTFEKQIGMYHTSSSGTAKNISQDSSGDIWTISFDKATDGYNFDKNYHAENQPVSLFVDIQSSGSTKIIITQGDQSITETVKSGNFTYDLSDFTSGKMKIQLICIDDTTDFYTKIVMETK